MKTFEAKYELSRLRFRFLKGYKCTVPKHILEELRYMKRIYGSRSDKFTELIKLAQNYENI